MNEQNIRLEMCRVGKSLFDRGYVRATAGNISVQLDDGHLITPIDACLGSLDPNQLARIDKAGEHFGGMRPSKTLELHRRIVKEAQRFDPATRCVVHNHSTHCVALSMKANRDELLDALTPYFTMKVGRVSCAPYERPGASATLDRVGDLISGYGAAGRPIRAVVLERLGPVVWHESPALAMAVLEELEETARLQLLCSEVAPLENSAVDVLRSTFGARW